MDTLDIDFETFSEADLGDVGAYRYAADPSTRILMMSISLNDAPARIVLPKYLYEFFPDLLDQEALRWASLLQERSIQVWAHSSGFETALATYRLEEDLGFLPPALEQWRCTSHLARRAALPASLEEAAKALHLPVQKDKRGKELIKLFSMPQTKGKQKGQRILPEDQPEAFREFTRYCLTDNDVQRGIRNSLRPFIPKGAAERTFILDTLINARGVPVNVDALRRTQVIIDQAQAVLREEFTRLTGFNATQRDRVLEWFRARGYPSDNMQAVSVTRALEDRSWTSEFEVRRALELKQELSFSAVGKVSTMLECECGDGVVRGTLVPYGAGPGRWTGKLIQPQNFKRPTISNTEEVYADICSGLLASADDLRLIYGDPLEMISSCVRHYIQLPGGQQMYDADYAAIEARIVCWLAGQLDALERFRLYDKTGSKEYDSYIRMACVVFNKVWTEVLKDERWLGKQTVLGCGFQMGPARFFDQCVTNAEKYKIKGINVTMELAERSVAAFRDEYDKVKQLWWDADRAARSAISNPGKRYKAGPYLSFAVIQVSGIPFLAMRLPAGRSIVYPHPMLEDNGKGGTDITYWGQLPKSRLWGRVKTYGGSIVENATQGTAADVMANGADVAIQQKFDIFLLVHDQALAAFDGRDVEEFVSCLTQLPAWASGLPIKAEGKVVPYYLKL